MACHEESVVVRFEDADPAGVVFYPRAIAMAHSVVENLIRRSAIGWAGWFASDTNAAPLRHAEADFFHPMRPGETFTARALVEKAGTTSVTFVVEFFSFDGSLAARVRTVHVLMDRASGRAMALTAEIRDALAAFSA